MEIKYYCYPEIDSTNSEARRRLTEGTIESPSVVYALSQTAGRGRQGKSFFSPKDAGVYMSVIIEPNCAVYEQVTITTRVAVAVAKAIAVVCGIQPSIKWVNDLYVGNRKVCGILCEAVMGQASSETGTQLLKNVIIGVGINVSTVSFPKELEGIAGSLDVNDEEKKGELIRAVAEKILEETADLKDLSYLSYYRKHSNVIGRDITFTEDGITTQARAVDIDDIGGLIVEISDENGKIKTRTLNSGEISVRL